MERREPRRTRTSDKEKALIRTVHSYQPVAHETQLRAPGSGVAHN